MNSSGCLAVWLQFRLLRAGNNLSARGASKFCCPQPRTTRKRLYQDTIVVLVTVVLMTVFLFLVDILWIKILTSEAIKVLQHDPQAALRKQQSGAQW